MYYRNQNDDKVILECNNCEKVYMFNKKYFSVISDNYCVNSTLLQCPNCKNMTYPNTKIEVKKDEIRCPSSGSTQITANTKGFGLGKAAAGAVLLGPVGLLGGVIGSNKIMITCLRCGRKWPAGK